MIKQHFRGIIWPRGLFELPEKLRHQYGVRKYNKLKKETEKTTQYRYIVVGLLVTDKPLEGLEGKNEILLDGHAAGIAEALETITQKKLATRVGDANDVLLRLQDLVEEDDA